MSRSSAEASAAWKAWLHIYSIGHDHPIGFTHQCDKITPLDVDQILHYDIIVCSGCHMQIEHPEKECTPVYPPPRTSKASKIRVLRILEYVYPNAEIASANMEMWTHSVRHGSGYVMRSVTMPMETIEWEEGSPWSKDTPA